MEDLWRCTKEAYEDFCAKQQATLQNSVQSFNDEENRSYERWQKLADLEEGYLRHKAKLHWLTVGDQNNAYFHRSTQIRRMQNSIWEVVGPNGETLTSMEAIKMEVVRFFEDFITHELYDIDILSMENLKNIVNSRCLEMDKEQLIKEVSTDEIKKVLFSMPNNKSPEPDGYTSEFFKAAWEIVGQDFTVAIQSFFEKGFLPKGLNTIILALIPKTYSPREMKDYRLISCCNLIYKVISKLSQTVLRGFYLGSSISTNLLLWNKDC